ncbi:sugar ABC transporter ATP-binding protein [Acidisoma silvae]|uniref:Sugar ABC transporter ATP-binding protein n=1 Tax=Acidisoma silvae TaxID=2802396 RepID=A0A963YVU6_9PROT|nr:sugar ABC transporter ATP-binding protein [Acidisoma silvae]MCB8877780.1 sugar ABC transporter ATP-binding protein [Acidisoma silvae]
MTGAVLLHMDDVAKRFGPVQALRGVSLNARAGEVLALMGENGAGKSTLLRLMSGVHQPDGGNITVDGQRVVFATPQAARAAGVRVVAQEPEIIPDVSVAENVYAGALPRRGCIFDRAGLRAQLEQDLARYGFTGVLDPAQLGRSLSPAQRQVIEILRALTGGARVIAFDEPTSSLSDHEVESLFRLIAQLKAEDIAVIYVSHRMKEIFRIADRILVLRDGASVGERQAAETDEPELVRMMVGRDLSALFPRSPRSVGAPVLSLHNITTEDVTSVSFNVRAGEIVALAGLVGAGRTELAHAIIGDTPIASGHIEVEGRQLTLRSPRDAVKAGLALAPEERKQQALLMKRSVRDNICLAILGRLQRWRVVSRTEEGRIARRYVQELRVRTPTIDQEVATLSGGNQQKTVLARWLAREAKLLILDEPTRGVDVGAKADIYAIIDKLAAQGSAILVISSELPEVLGLADRILVMQGGRIRGEISRAEATEEKILSLAILENAA